jgi:carbon starvation protein
MSSALVALVVLAVFALAYRVYGRFIGERVYDDGEAIVTPAHALRDGTDFVPTNRNVLMGHHFASIAGAAPIIGPCIAAYWGWLPALLWIVVGAIFMGAVHDFGALVASVREKGRSIGDIAGTVMSGRARLMFLCFVALLVWLVLAVFALTIAEVFVQTPSSVIPVNASLVLAPIVGVAIYRRGRDPLIPSLVALSLLYAAIYVGTLYPIDLREVFGLDAQGAKTSWLLFLFIYCGVASLLPVWLLLQPRDFINGQQLVVGMILLFAGLFVAHPVVEAPAFRASSDGAPPIFPFLFVTVACGAISGFHGLVSSGTTSKQVNELRDTRMIGYGSMLGEGTLAVAALLSAVAGLGLVTGVELPNHGHVEQLSWELYYEDWTHAITSGPRAFVLGGGALLESLGVPADIARTLMAVLVICFAATSLDTAARIQRLVMAEIGAATSIKPLENRFVAMSAAILPAVYLAFAKRIDVVTGEERPLGLLLWPIFGATNQMLAALTLLVLALWVSARKRPALPLVIPMIVVSVVTLLSLVEHLRVFAAQANWAMAGLAGLLVVMVLWMLAEGAGAYFRRRAAQSRAA